MNKDHIDLLRKIYQDPDKVDTRALYEFSDAWEPVDYLYENNYIFKDKEGLWHLTDKAYSRMGWLKI